MFLLIQQNRTSLDNTSRREVIVIENPAAGTTITTTINDATPTQSSGRSTQTAETGSVTTDATTRPSASDSRSFPSSTARLSTLATSSNTIKSSFSTTAVPSSSSIPATTTGLDTSAIGSTQTPVITSSTAALSSPSVLSDASSSGNHQLLSKSHVALIAGITAPVAFLFFWALGLTIYRRCARQKRQDRRDTVTWPSGPDIPANDRDSEKALEEIQRNFDTPYSQGASTYQMPYSSSARMSRIYDHSSEIMVAPVMPPVPIDNFGSDFDLSPSVTSPYDHPTMIRIRASTPVQRSSTPVSLTPGGNPARFGQSVVPAIPNPTPPVRVPEGTVASIVAEFIPSLPDELPIQIGETVRVLAIYDDGWVYCGKINSNSQGMIPAECLAIQDTRISKDLMRKTSLKRTGSLSSKY